MADLRAASAPVAVPTRRFPYLDVAKLTGLAALVVLTNFGFGQRVSVLLARQDRFILAVFLALWVLSLAALLVAAWHPSARVRLVWAALIAGASALSIGYYVASQSQLTVFEFISLWAARHEAGRAAEFYRHALWVAVAVFAAWVAVIMWRPRWRPTFSRPGRIALALVPAVPPVLMAGVMWLHAGGGSQALPGQFAPLAVTALAAKALAGQTPLARGAVPWTAQGPPQRNLVLMLDESVRADFVDFTPGNTTTPGLAALSGQLVNFGPAVSGGDCSSYSGAILRFGVSRRDVVATANTNPTLFEYARHAGYRTVFIDAQAAHITNPGLLQNFMSMEEKAKIDAFYAIKSGNPAEADYELARIIHREISGPSPVFILAAKNGAHFPYDEAYPPSEAVFHPTQSESKADTHAARLASYRNAVRWSVEKLLPEFFASADLTHTTLIYTSDHGQIFEPGELTHCKVEDPDPRMGLVPLLAYSSEPEIKAALQKGAELSQGRASHFLIAPTLLKLMGYQDQDLATLYDESLFSGTTRAPAFTSGDIFGLVSRKVNWTEVPLGHTPPE